MINDNQKTETSQLATELCGSMKTTLTKICADLEFLIDLMQIDGLKPQLEKEFAIQITKLRFYGLQI